MLVFEFKKIVKNVMFYILNNYALIRVCISNKMEFYVKVCGFGMTKYEEV